MRSLEQTIADELFNTMPLSPAQAQAAAANVMLLVSEFASAEAAGDEEFCDSCGRLLVDGLHDCPYVDDSLSRCPTSCFRDFCGSACHNDHVPMIYRRHSPGQCPTGKDAR